MKELKDMTLDEQVSWAAGTLLIAIGEGKFRERLYTIIPAFQSIGFDRAEARRSNPPKITPFQR